MLFSFFSFFFNATATTEIYTLSLHDALPIFSSSGRSLPSGWTCSTRIRPWRGMCSTSSITAPDRKSTRLNSSHVRISYAVFCLKKKKDQDLQLLLQLSQLQHGLMRQTLQL